MLIYASIIQGFSNFFQNLENSIPIEYRVIVSLLIYTIFIVLYSVFIWKFYRFMAEREIIKLNLSKHNFSNHPTLEKSIDVAFNILEYVIILPFLVFFWFTVFSIFLLVLSKSQSSSQILLISAAIIASTRITAYISENLSRDIAKIFPFTVLALFLLDPDFFKLELVFDKIIQIPDLFNHILIFIIFIFGIELILRMFYSIIKLFYSNRGIELEEKEED